MFREILESKSDYIVYHNTYSRAISEILDFVEKNGYLLDDLNNDYEGEQVDKNISLGDNGGRPKVGQTTKGFLTLYKKRKSGSSFTYKEQKKALSYQIYNRGTNGNEFELNMYIN